MDHDHAAHHAHAHEAAAAAVNISNAESNFTATDSTTTTTISHAHTDHHSHIPMHHDSAPHEHSPMQMYFHGGCSEVILFSFWQIDSVFGLLFSIVLIFLMGVLYEGIKWFRVYFQLWTSNGSKATAGCSTLNILTRSKSRQHGADDALIEKTVADSSASAPFGCKSCGPQLVNSNSSAGNTLSQEVYAPTVVISTPAGSGTPINRWTWLMMYVSREFSPKTCKMIEMTIYATQLLLAYWLMLIAMTFNIYLTAAVVFGAAFGHWLFANIKCAPPRRCYCPACCMGVGGPENVDEFASDACH